MRLSRMMLLVAGCALGLTPAVRADNYVQVTLTRVDDKPLAFNGFFVTVDVGLDAAVGATAVQAALPGGAMAVLEDELGSGAFWSEELEFATFADFRNAIDGMWTLSITGPASSTSTFTLGVSSLMDGDLFPVPAVTMPMHGATDVPLDTNFGWTDPTGGHARTPDAVVAIVQQEIGMAEVAQQAVLAPTALTWDPPVNLVPGFAEFDVFYLDADSSLAGALAVTAGDIMWGNSPLAPMGWPAATPLVSVGSQTIIGFQTVPEPATAALLALVSVAALRPPRRRER